MNEEKIKIEMMIDGVSLSHLLPVSTFVLEDKFPTLLPNSTPTPDPVPAPIPTPTPTPTPPSAPTPTPTPNRVREVAIEG